MHLQKTPALRRLNISVISFLKVRPQTKNRPTKWTNRAAEYSPIFFVKRWHKANRRVEGVRLLRRLQSELGVERF